MIPGAEEIGRTTRSFFDVLRDQPLSLALVAMNTLLIAYLFYSGSQMLSQRQDMARAILDWTSRTDTLLSSCVSLDVTKLILDNMQRITDTMIGYERVEINRMQRAIDREREINSRLQGLPVPPSVADPVPLPRPRPPIPPDPPLPPQPEPRPPPPPLQ